MRIDGIGVVGAGNLGSSLVPLFATRFRVTLVDVDREALNRAESTIERALRRREEAGELEAGTAEVATDRLAFSREMESLKGPRFIVEAVPEDVDLKRTVLESLDRIAVGEAVLATTSSTIPLTRLAAVTRRAPRVVGLHPVDAFGEARLVEVVRGIDTSDPTLSVTSRVVEAIGCVPVRVEDRPGLVARRILLPLINEAIRCLEESVAEARVIDRIGREGLDLPLGPLEMADAIGLDECLRGLEALQRETGDDRYRPSALLRRLVDAGRHGRDAGMGFYPYIDDRR